MEMQYKLERRKLIITRINKNVSEFKKNIYYCIYIKHI